MSHGLCAALVGNSLESSIPSENRQYKTEMNTTKPHEAKGTHSPLPSLKTQEAVLPRAHKLEFHTNLTLLASYF